jgi:hypothetical protein
MMGSVGLAVVVLAFEQALTGLGLQQEVDVGGPGLVVLASAECGLLELADGR